MASTFIPNGAAGPILTEMMTCHHCSKFKRTFTRPARDRAPNWKVHAIYCKTCHRTKYMVPEVDDNKLLGYHVTTERPAFLQLRSQVVSHNL